VRQRWPLRLAVLVVFGAGLGAFLAFGGHRMLSFETFSQHHTAIKSWVSANLGLAMLAFLSLYSLGVALSVPGAVWMSIAGGYLFGTVPAAGLIVLGATLGATAIFLAARFVFGESWRARVSRGTMARLEQGFRDNAFSSLLVLRLVPLFPFWLVNLVPAFLGVPARTFIVATALGIIPGTFVYASVGNGLEMVLATGGMPDLGIIYDPEILGPLLGLAALATLPSLYRWWKGRPS